MSNSASVSLARWCFAALVVCSASAPAVAQPATPTNVELRAKLLQMERDDQAAREGFARAFSLNDAAYLASLAVSDSKRLLRLKEIVAAVGWPSVALVGRDGTRAPKSNVAMRK